MKKIRVSQPKEAAPLVTSHIREVAKGKEGTINIALPGGRGAVPVVEGSLALEDQLLQRVSLILVDERLTGSTNRDTLLNVGLREAIEKGRFKEEQLNTPELNVPPLKEGEHFDLVYLGIGEDGHIASLFPEAYPELDDKEVDDVVYIANSPKPPPERLTFSFRAFRKYAKKGKIYLLFFGEGKRVAYKRFLEGKESPSTLPSLYFPREWFDFSIITNLEEN